MTSGKVKIDLSKRSEFSQLFLSYQLEVYRYIYGMTGGPPQLVEDLAAEAFSRAWKSRHHFNGGSAEARGWLLTIARNLMIDQARKAKTGGREVPIGEAEQELPTMGPDTPEAQHLAGEQREMLWRELQRLPKETKEILILRYMLEWRVVEIADYLGKKESAISMRIRRALKELQHVSSRANPSVKRGEK